MFEAVEFPPRVRYCAAFLSAGATTSVSCRHHDPWDDRHHHHGTRPLCGGILPLRLGRLLYDHLNFGMSGGELRQQINTWIQARGYRDAMNYLLTRDDVRAKPL